MTRAKVSELKARLSAYLAEVRGGGEVIVYDRATPIARLVPFAASAGTQWYCSPLLTPAQLAPSSVERYTPALVPANRLVPLTARN